MSPKVVTGNDMRFFLWGIHFYCPLPYYLTKPLPLGIPEKQKQPEVTEGIKRDWKEQ